MCIWPLTNEERIKCQEKVNSSRNWEIASFESDAKWDSFYGPIVSNLREILPEPLNMFEQGLHRNGKHIRKRYLHFWYDNIPNIHFELEVKSGNKLAIIGVHVEMERQLKLAKRLRRYLSDQIELAQKEKHLFHHEVKITGIDANSSIIIGRHIRDMIGLWVPRIREALLYSTRI